MLIVVDFMFLIIDLAEINLLIKPRTSVIKDQPNQHLLSAMHVNVTMSRLKLTGESVFVLFQMFLTLTLSANTSRYVDK